MVQNSSGAEVAYLIVMCWEQQGLKAVVPGLPRTGTSTETKASLHATS